MQNITGSDFEELYRHLVDMFKTMDASKKKLKNEKCIGNGF